MPGTNILHISKKKKSENVLSISSSLFCAKAVFFTGLAAVVPNLGMNSLFTRTCEIHDL